MSRPGYFCKKVVDEAARYFVEKKPEIEFIHFSDPDDLGHSDGWMSNPQLEAVRAHRQVPGHAARCRVGRRPRSRNAVHHLGGSRRPRPQSRRQDQGGPPDPLDRVGPRHPARPPSSRPTSAPPTRPPPRCGSSAIRPPRASSAAPSSKPSNPTARTPVVAGVLHYSRGRESRCASAWNRRAERSPLTRCAGFADVRSASTGESRAEGWRCGPRAVRAAPRPTRSEPSRSRERSAASPRGALRGGPRTLPGS